MYTFSSGNLFLWKCGNLFSVEIRETSWIISYTFDVTLQEIYLGVTYCFHFLQQFMRNFPSAFRVLAVPLRNMLTPRKNYTTNQMINWCYGGSKDKNRRDCEEIQYTGWTDVKEKTHAGVIVQKLETEDTLTGLTDVEENAYVGALPNEDRWKYIHRLNRRCIGQLHRFSCPERWFLEEREEVTITG